MRKRVFVIHGWTGTPERDWLPWLKGKLEEHDLEVTAPAMPNTDTPVIEKWVKRLQETVGGANKDTYFVGHSLGCQAILRYLEKLPGNVKVGGVVFVAGFFTLSNLKPEEEPIAKPWVEGAIDCSKVKLHTNRFIAIFSDDDPYVPLKNIKMFEDKLGTKVVIEHNKKHLSEDGGILELPSALEAVLELGK